LASQPDGAAEGYASAKKPITGHWKAEGAYVLRQTRTWVLNNELERLFQQWYPGVRPPHRNDVYAAA
jgi:hypothetical protein